MESRSGRRFLKKLRNQLYGKQLVPGKFRKTRRVLQIKENRQKVTGLLETLDPQTLLLAA